MELSALKAVADNNGIGYGDEKTNTKGCVKAPKLALLPTKYYSNLLTRIERAARERPEQVNCLASGILLKTGICTFADKDSSEHYTEMITDHDILEQCSAFLILKNSNKMGNEGCC